MGIRKYICETTGYDKKQEVERRKVKSWLKSVSVFANGIGGSPSRCPSSLRPGCLDRRTGSNLS